MNYKLIFIIALTIAMISAPVFVSAYDIGEVHCVYDGAMGFSCSDGLWWYSTDYYPYPQEMIDYYANLNPAKVIPEPDINPITFAVEGSSTQGYSGLN